MIGTTLSHFKITAKLGEGGMGEVYRAEDTKLDREVAIKVLPDTVASDAERLARFEREAKVLASLNHPNIAAIYSFEQATLKSPAGSEAVRQWGVEGMDEVGRVEGASLPQGPNAPMPQGPSASVPQSPNAPMPQGPSASVPPSVHFLVMELVDGPTLQEMIENGVPLEQSLEIAEQVAEALAVAHEKGIVHRDLKPANVMLTADGRIKVLDFGLAKLALEAPGRPAEGATQVATLTEAGLVMGTAPYMSPEQAQGLEVDARSDIFSLASLLYEAATGIRPFSGDTTIDTLHKVVHAEPAPLSERIPNAPLQLQWILRKALAKSPDDRYQSARDLVVDLKSLRRDLDSDSHLPTVTSGQVPAVAASGTKRSPALWAALTAIVLIAVAGLFWTLGRWAAEPVETTTPRTALTKRPITASGLVTSAAISPDGKYMAFVESLQGEQSLNLRQVGGAQSLQLIEPRNVAYWGVTFNPEGTAVVFGIKSDVEPNGAFFQISTLGGSPKKLVERIDSRPTYSPDGARMAWLVAQHPEQDQSSIMVANADGSDAQVLASWSYPELVAPIFFTGPSWSPDGRWIATSVLAAEGQRGARVVAVDAQTGTVEWTSEDEWRWSAMVGWLPSGDGLLAIAEPPENDDAQIWLVPFPAGEARQVTSDLFDYRIISLTADGRSLLTIPAEGRSDIFTLPLTGGQRPRKISRSRLDGVFGFDFIADGRLVYQTLDAGRLDLALMSIDGSERQRLTDDEEGERYPRVAPDGRIVVRTSTATGFKLRRLDADGGNPHDLFDGFLWGSHNISPDGEWVVYTAITEGVLKIWRVPLEGGTPELVIDLESFIPVVSPDGSKVAFYFKDPEDDQYRIGVAGFEEGELEIELEAEAFYGSTRLQWTADGASLMTNTVAGDRANLYRLPLDGSAYERLTDFDDRRLFWYEFAPDGETLVVSRGELSRDAVLIENFLPPQ